MKQIQIAIDRIQILLIGNKPKNSTITPNNKNYDKCFSYGAILALNHKEIRKNSERLKN